MQSPNTNQWLDVPCNPEAFVVNTGVAMQRLTNDHYKVAYQNICHEWNCFDAMNAFGNQMHTLERQKVVPVQAAISSSQYKHVE